MSNQTELIDWLNSQVDGYDIKANSLQDLADGQEICLFLTLLANPESTSKISKGNTQYDFSKNFRLAKTLFGLLGKEFDFEIQKLTQGDEDELLNLLSTLPSLTESEEMTLDDLIIRLENDLSQKLQEMKEFRQQMDKVAAERDFYFDKLLRIEKASHSDSYKASSASAVWEYLEVSPLDFRAESHQ